MTIPATWACPSAVTDLLALFRSPVVGFQGGFDSRRRLRSRIGHGVVEDGGLARRARAGCGSFRLLWLPALSERFSVGCQDILLASLVGLLQTWCAMAWVNDVPLLNCSTAVARSPAAPVKSDFQAMPVPINWPGTEAKDR